MRWTFLPRVFGGARWPVIVWSLLEEGLDPRRKLPKGFSVPAFFPRVPDRSRYPIDLVIFLRNW